MNAELRTLNHMSNNVDIGLFSVDTITLQHVYLAWDNAIYAHTPAVLHSPQDVDDGRVAGFVQV